MKPLRGPPGPDRTAIPAAALQAASRAALGDLSAVVMDGTAHIPD